MTKIINNAITIFEALQNIQNGKYVMPAFQRQYVWDMYQIEKLWDSILLDYPIANFLFWHLDLNNVTWDTYFCRFLNSTTFTSNRTSDNINFQLLSIDTNITDIAILDGQQRLTSIYLSLLGTIYIRDKHARKKTFGGTIANLIINLNKNNIDENDVEYNNKHFDIRFIDKIGKIQKGEFNFRNIIDPKFQNKETRQDKINEIIENVNNDSKEYAQNILNKLCEKIYDEKLINYTEILDMQQDDALEMFVRFNSGGRALKPSEITMSILEAYWGNARNEFGKLLVDYYPDFSTDFLIRTALMLYGNVEKTIIDKQISENLKNNWQSFKLALVNLTIFLTDNNISVSRFSGTWNVLIPLIFFIYKNHDYKNYYSEMKKYLARAIFFTYFQTGTKSKLQKLKKKITQNDYTITIDLLDNMQELRVTESKIEDLLNTEKGSKIAGEVLYFLNLDWINNNLKYEQDHLHPSNAFSDDNFKPISINYNVWRDWKSIRNRLPNLHLLEGRNNASKSDIRLIDYYNTMNTEQQKLFLRQAHIPSSLTLEFDNFGYFYEKRKKYLEEKIKILLI